jgi:predicted hydrocarbon binding protein
MNTDQFYGEKEYTRLKAYPPVLETFEDAQKYIVTFIQAGEPDDNSVPQEEKEKVRDRNAKARAHFLWSIEQSLEHIPGYATLDHHHLIDILHLINSIHLYINDTARLRPLNFMMNASPGEGKSHFIDCIAQKMEGKLLPVSFNMTSMREVSDLVPVLDRARNAAIEGKIPLIFLDEFDADNRNYALLLPLLLEGQIVLGTRSLKIGRAVIVLAGSTKTLELVLKQARGEKLESEQQKMLPGKSVDLVSRINGGVIEISSLNERSERRVDKICVAIALLRRKYGNTLKRVPASLLSFIYKAHFNYGVRSILHFIELLGNSKPGPNDNIEKVVNDEGVLDIVGLNNIFEDLKRIEQAGLVYHIKHDYNVEGIQENWKESIRLHRHYAPVWCRVFNDLGRPTSWSHYDAGGNSVHMYHELRGDFKADKQEDKQLDYSSMVGIEPYHLTKLWINEEIGEWNHGKKDMRHVFFNLGTLHQILSEVISDPDHAKGVGHRMGKEFGKDFVSFLPLENARSEPIAAVIEKWCRFDVSGGWGKWVHVRSASELHVCNNFLADRIPMGPTPAGKSPFCPIMEGYIQGVLEEIIKAVSPEKNCSVKVDEIVCGISNPKEKPCRFKYKIDGLDHVV